MDGVRRNIRLGFHSLRRTPGFTITAGNGAAAVRVAVPFSVGIQFELLTLSAACWSLAFGLFVLRYGPMLVRPWVRKR